MLGCVLRSVAVVGWLASPVVAADAAISDPSTWRWAVTTALGEQRANDEAVDTARAAAVFRQNYERYSPAGAPESGR